MSAQPQWTQVHYGKLNPFTETSSPSFGPMRRTLNASTGYIHTAGKVLGLPLEGGVISSANPVSCSPSLPLTFVYVTIVSTSFYLLLHHTAKPSALNLSSPQLFPLSFLSSCFPAFMVLKLLLSSFSLFSLTS